MVRGGWTLQEDCAVGTVPTLLTREGGSLVTGYGEMLPSVSTVQPAFLFLEDCRDNPHPHPAAEKCLTGQSPSFLSNWAKQETLDDFWRQELLILLSLDEG